MVTILRPQPATESSVRLVALHVCLLAFLPLWRQSGRQSIDRPVVCPNLKKCRLLSFPSFQGQISKPHPTIDCPILCSDRILSTIVSSSDVLKTFPIKYDPHLIGKRFFWFGWRLMGDSQHQCWLNGVGKSTDNRSHVQILRNFCQKHGDDLAGNRLEVSSINWIN